VTSLFELFKIGIGPSSSHTVGPMRASLAFVRGLERAQVLINVARVRVDLYGSLALTGIGHGTDTAILAGLSGEAPDSIEPGRFAELIDMAATGALALGGIRQISFVRNNDLVFHNDQMYPDADIVTHPNGVRFTAYDADHAVIATEVFYSIGGGFIVTAEHFTPTGSATPQSSRRVPYPFRSAAQLLQVAATTKSQC
jgi:L-serine dehydratase